MYRFKQKGEAAERADNVFHHLTYEGAVDVTQISDKRERHALECQINEFGQCPRQIFAAPHPRRLLAPSSSEAMEIAERSMQGEAMSIQGLFIGLCTCACQLYIYAPFGFGQITA